MGAFGAGFGIYRSGGSGSTTITGTGTPNFQARFLTANTIGDGVIQDDGTTTSIGTAPVANQTLTIKGDDTTANHSLILTDSADVTQFGFRNDGTLELTAAGKIAYADGFGGNLISDSTTAIRTWNFPDASGEILLDNLLAQPNGIATLDGGGKVPNSQLPFELMEFLGNWDASTNTPTLSNTDVGAQGNTYKVSVAGTVDFGAGNISFDVGDWVVNNGTIWEKVDNTDAVTSVNGNTGAVTTPLSAVLAQGNTTGANSISVNAGQNIIYNNSSFTTTLGTVTLTANRIINYPNNSGTIALTTDIPSVAITDDVLPRGTGTGIEDGTWENVGNDIYPTTTGSNIGDATHRIGTIFMSSTVDHTTDLNFISGGNIYNIIRADGSLDLARTAGRVRIGDVAANVVTIQSGITQQSSNSSGTTWTGFYAYNNSTTPDVQTALVANRFGYTAIRTSHDFSIETNWTGGMGTSSTPQFKLFVSTGNVSIGTVTQGAKLKIRGVGSTLSTFGLQVESVGGGARNFAVRDDGLTQFSTTSSNVNGVGDADLMVGTTTNTDNLLSPMMDFNYQHNPISDGNGRKIGLYVRTQKLGDFNSIESVGILGEGYWGGTGDQTNAGLIVGGVTGQARNVGQNVTIQQLWGLRGNVQTQAGVGNEATIVNMGALFLNQSQVQDTNVTNLYGIYLTEPTNISGANVTTSYAFRAEANTLGTTNYGIYIEGSSTINYLQGSLGIGIAAPTAALQVEGSVRLSNLTTTPAAGYVLQSTDVNGNADWLNISGSLVPAITSNVIPRGTGSNIQDGTWENVGNDIYPTTTGSNIGDATHRIGTIFMASVIDFSASLSLKSGANTYHTFDTTGNVDLVKTGAGVVTIGTVASGAFKLNVENNLYVKSTSGNAEIEISADAVGQAFLQINNQNTNLDSYLHFANAGTNKVSIGWDDSADSFKMGTLSIATSTWYENNTTTNVARHTNSLGIGLVTPSSTQRLVVRGTGNTQSSFAAIVENVGGTRLFAVRDDGLTQLNTTGSSLVAFGTITSQITQNSITDETTFYTLSGKELNYNPAANSTAFVRAEGSIINKNGAFNANTLIGSANYIRNNGTGNITAAYGTDSFIWNTAATTTITDFWANRALIQNQGTGTITNFGGYRVLFGQQNAGTITNRYGFKTEVPSNTGAAVTNHYGLFLSSSTDATNNYGLYQQGANNINYLEGNLGIGVVPSADALLELQSTTKALLIMRMTAAQASAITPADGMILYATSTDATFTAIGFWGYENGTWIQF